MRTMIIGNGFVGQAYMRALNYLGETPWLLSRAWIDYTDINVLSLAFKNYKPELVINCAGYTGVTVDDCESNIIDTAKANSQLPGEVAVLCHVNRSKLIHISTGCMFFGSGPFNEQHMPNFVINNYQISKYIAEQNVSLHCDDFWIFRIRMPFSHVPHKRNWLCKLQDYAKFGSILDGLNSATWIDELALRSFQLIQKSAPGIYHAAQSNPVRTLAVARMLRELVWEYDPVDFEKNHVKRSEAVLDCSKFEKAYGTPFTDTMTALRWCIPILQNGGNTIQPYGAIPHQNQS